MSSNGDTRTDSLEADVVVIGGGGAGSAAAVAAAENGVKVILLEARRVPGGNAVFAGSLFAVGSQLQKSMGIKGTGDEFFKRAMKYTHWKTNPRLIRALIDKSGDTVQWLEEKGMKFDRNGLANLGEVPKAYSLGISSGRTGPAIVKLLIGKCEEMGVRVLCQTRARQLLTNTQGKLTGVMAEAETKNIKINTKSVIIATGGFAGNTALLKKYFPSYNEDMYLVGLPLQGDGWRMATEIGAAVDGVVVLEMAGPDFPWSSYLSTIAKQPQTLWVNKTGERFTEEGVDRFEKSNSIYKQPDKTSYTLFDEDIKQIVSSQELDPVGQRSIAKEPSWTAAVDSDIKLQEDKGMVKKCNSWDELAEWMGTAPEALKATIDEYNSLCDRGHDDVFAKDKKYLLPLRTPPYYAIKCCLRLLVTHGDIKINHHMEVLDKQEKPLSGLYAAGVDIGGKESDTYAAELPAHSYGFAVNSGRIAGENAAECVKDKR